MQKAYDTFLQCEVYAELAAKICEHEPYRYECAHCGEEVRIAAACSISRVPYFKHRSGNNDVKCEKYLGQYRTISTDSRSRKSKNERAEFYFDKGTKLFYVGIRFSDNEIAAYEQLTTTFELRASAKDPAFHRLLINRRNFEPDVPTMIPIQRFSNNYFLSNTLNGVKRKYEVFKNGSSNALAFFKIQSNDNDYKAKLVRSSVLYTNVPYFVVFQSQYNSSWDSHLPNDIVVDDTIRFETMGRKFMGKKLIIYAKNTIVDSLLMSWGYQLEVSESLALLWPAASTVDGVTLIRTNYAYLYSSFDLQAHGNINIHSGGIRRIADGISRVVVNSRIKVYRKNAEIVIDKDKPNLAGFEQIKVEKIQETDYTVSDDYKHFLFSGSGVVPLVKGQCVSLTTGSIIKRYLFGYMNGYVYPRISTKLAGECLLIKILAYYKREEAFIWNDFDSLELSQTAFCYIENCEKSGFINSAVKYFIKEGRI